MSGLILKRSPSPVGGLVVGRRLGAGQLFRFYSSHAYQIVSNRMCGGQLCLTHTPTTHRLSFALNYPRSPLKLAAHITLTRIPMDLTPPPPHYNP